MNKLELRPEEETVELYNISGEKFTEECYNNMEDKPVMYAKKITKSGVSIYYLLASFRELIDASHHVYNEHRYMYTWEKVSEKCFKNYLLYLTTGYNSRYLTFAQREFLI